VQQIENKEMSFTIKNVFFSLSLVYFSTFNSPIAVTVYKFKVSFSSLVYVVI